MKAVRRKLKDDPQREIWVPCGEFMNDDGLCFCVQRRYGMQSASAANIFTFNILVLK